MTLFRIRVEPGQEVIEAVTDAVVARGITEAAIVSLIGAVDSCCISNMAADDATSDVLAEYSSPLEMSGTGEIIDAKVHIHTALSGEGNVAHHGHLHWAQVQNWFVDAYVMELD